jgi:hypothetical protein
MICFYLHAKGTNEPAISFNKPDIEIKRGDFLRPANMAPSKSRNAWDFWVRAWRKAPDPARPLASRGLDFVKPRHYARNALPIYLSQVNASACQSRDSSRSSPRLVLKDTFLFLGDVSAKANKAIASSS